MTPDRHPAPEGPTRRLGVGRALHGLLRVTEWVVLGVAVVACVVFSVGTLTGRLLLQTVPTGSMEPVIPKGSAIMVEHQAVSTIEVGDVIVFAAPETGTMTVHRIIEISEIDGVRTFTTKGDNNPGPDPWSLQLNGQKVHKVTTVLPVLGTVLTDAGQPRARIALMVVGGLLVLVAGFFAIWRRDERRRDERRLAERRHGDRRHTNSDAEPWPSHLERRVGEPRSADRRVGDRREADRRHDGDQRRTSETRVVHDHPDDRRRTQRTHSSVHALGKTLGTTVAAIVAMTLIPTTVAHASFTGSGTARSTVGTGSLAVPSGISCRWTSATATSVSWSLAAGIQTNTQALQQSTSTGAITVAATVASSVTSASVSPTAPVTTPRYLSARTTKGTWTSAQSAQVTTDQCAGAIVLFAGNGTNSFAGDGGAATAASLSTPNLMDEGPDGRVFIADTGNNCIRKIDTSGAVTRVAGGGATTTCTSSSVTASSLSLSGPAGVAIAPNGDVIVADTGRNCVRRISGTNATIVAGGGATTTCSSSQVTASALLLAAPQGVAVGANGDVIIADTGRNCVRRISGTTATLVAGGGATTTCTASTPTGVSLSGPEAVAIASNGDVIIADTGRACVRRATAAAVTQLAFTGSNGTAGDNGPAIAATVRSPAGLSVTASGDLLVSDRATNNGNSDVRRVRSV